MDCNQANSGGLICNYSLGNKGVILCEHVILCDGVKTIFVTFQHLGVCCGWFMCPFQSMSSN